MRRSLAARWAAQPSLFSRLRRRFIVMLRAAADYAERRCVAGTGGRTNRNGATAGWRSTHAGARSARPPSSWASLYSPRVTLSSVDRHRVWHAGAFRGRRFNMTPSGHAATTTLALLRAAVRLFTLHRACGCLRPPHLGTACYLPSFATPLYPPARCRFITPIFFI